MGNVQPLEVVGRGSKTQLQMAENLNVSFIVQDTKGLGDTHPTLHATSDLSVNTNTLIIVTTWSSIFGMIYIGVSLHIY